MSTHTMPSDVAMNQPPSNIDLHLVENHAATLTAAGIPPQSILEFNTDQWPGRTPAMDGETAIWRLSADDVASLAQASKVRLVLDGELIASGTVHHLSEWPERNPDGSQQIAYTMGLPGTGIDTIEQPVPEQMLIRLTNGKTHDVALPSGAEGVGISTISQPEPGRLQIELTDGRTQEWALPAGLPGPEGRGIHELTQESPGMLQITLSDGTTRSLSLPSGSHSTGFPHLTEEAIARAQGYAMVVSDTPPETSTQYGVPVIWIQSRSLSSHVPVLASMPLADPEARTITFPDPLPTGVEYTVDGAPAGARWTAADSDLVTVAARAKPGYRLIGPVEWTFSLRRAQARTLIAGDNFADMASDTPLIPPLNGDEAQRKDRNIIFGREWSIPGSEKVRWCSWVSTKTTLVSSATRGITSSLNTQYADFDLGREDYILETDITEAGTAHGLAITLKLGLGVHRQGGAEIALVCRSGTWGIHRTPVSGLSPEEVIGTWRFMKRGEMITVSSPGQENIAVVSAKQTSAWGTWGRLHMTRVRSQAPVIGEVRIYE